MDEEQRRFQQFEREGWSELAASYGELAEGFTGAIAEPLLDAAGVTAGTSVLDIATGPGFTAHAAWRRGAAAVGVDIAPGMVELARVSVPSVEFYVGAAEALPFDDGRFGAVVSAFGLPHFADHVEVFAECRRVLGAGGRLAMSTWLPPAENPYFAAILGAISQQGDLSAAHLPQGEDMFAHAESARASRDLESAGFDDIAVERTEVMFECNVGEFGHILTRASVRMGALFSAQSPTAQAAIIDHIVTSLEPHTNEGHVQVPVAAVIVSARTR